MRTSYESVIRNADQLLSKLSDPIYLIGLDDKVIWVNEAFETLFGYTADYLHSHGLEFYPQYNAIEIQEVKNQFQYKERIGSLYSSRYTKEGKRIYCNLNIVPIRGEEREIVAYTIIVKDVALGSPTSQQSDRRFHLIAENSSDTIVLVDNDAIVRYVSPAIYDLAGYHVEDYEGRDAFDVIHPEDREQVRRFHMEAVQTKKPVNLEYRVFHRNGEVVYVEARVVPVLDRNENMEYVVAVARNVTERKMTEHLLQSVLDNVDAAVWSSNREFTRFSLCSESIEKLFGFGRAVVEQNPMLLHHHVHPDDVGELIHVVGKTLRLGTPVTSTFRAQSGAGEPNWIKMISKPITNKSGEVERIDGIFLDYTKQKMAELALEESEQRYKSLFENNLDGVFSINLDGTFENANRSFESLLTLEGNRLETLTFLDLVSRDDAETVRRKLADVLELEASCYFECRIDRFVKDDKILSITLVPIFRGGVLNGVHGIVKDITERKKEERELMFREERTKLLQQSLNRLSHDLADCMKVSELERQFIEEMQGILPIQAISIEAVPKGLSRQSDAEELDLWIKISEKEHLVYLHMKLERRLLSMEEEYLQTAARYVTILYDNLHLIEDLMNQLEGMVAANETPRWMLRLLFKLSEKERFALSSDLHDTVLQDLIIWYRKLESLKSTNAFAEPVLEEMIRIEEGLLDAIHQIRITCNELRPPFLLKMGLVESLKSLLTYTKMFANHDIEFTADRFDGELGEEQTLCIYRVVQELLNNASKHSKASLVRMSLFSESDNVQFSYSDDGIGMDLSNFNGSFQHMGLSGIEKRVMSLNGQLEIQSAPNQGFHLQLILPKQS